MAVVKTIKDGNTIIRFHDDYIEKDTQAVLERAKEVLRVGLYNAEQAKKKVSG